MKLSSFFLFCMATCSWNKHHGVHGFVVPSSTNKKSFQHHSSFTLPTRRHFTTTSSSTALQVGLPPLPAVDGSRLINLLLEKVIETSVPALAVALVVGYVASTVANKNKKSDSPDNTDSTTEIVDELYSDLYQGTTTTSSNKPDLKSMLFGSSKNKKNKNKKPNLGIPTQEYIKVEQLNQKYDNYKYSMTAATSSKAKAAAQARDLQFNRALKLGVDSSWSALTAHQKSRLLKLEREFLENATELWSSQVKLQQRLTEKAIDEQMKKMGVSTADVDPEINNQENVDNSNNSNATTTATTAESTNKNSTSTTTTSTKYLELVALMARGQKALTLLEAAFCQDVIRVLGPERANGVRAALLGGSSTTPLVVKLQERPLSALLDQATSTKSLFVTLFNGDVSASQVKELREEVTAICRSAQPGDEALVVLQTGGGTVVGYGLAAGQLLRLKEAGLKLTICVEQVAASGGYMMACVADKIVASPFAVLGSIGVIAEMPNLYERLKREGIEFQTVTAGEYKRKLTPTKKVTKADFDKEKEDIEDVFGLFKDFVSKNRPSLDIDKVATGETWFGDRALELGLCDELKTVDDVLVGYVDEGYNVYQVKYDPTSPQENALGDLQKLLPTGMVKRAIRWIVQTVAAEVKEELGDRADAVSKSAKDKYLFYDDSSDRIKSE